MYWPSQLPISTPVPLPVGPPVDIPGALMLAGIVLVLGLALLGIALLAMATDG